jgi:hypothetical protein
MYCQYPGGILVRLNETIMVWILQKHDISYNFNNNSNKGHQQQKIRQSIIKKEIMNNNNEGCQ